MFIFKKFTPHPPRQEQEHPVVKVSVVLLWLKMGQELTLSATPETGMTVPGEADVMIAYLSRKFPDTFLPSLIYLPLSPPIQRTRFILFLPWRTL